MSKKQLQSRRSFLRSSIAGSLIMSGLLSELLHADDGPIIAPLDPLAPRQPHFPARAKSVIFLNMSGGVSHIDSFDPKPALFADHGKQITLDHPEVKNRAGYEKIFLKRPDWQFKSMASVGWK